MNPLVTVSVPLFKCEDFLEACLESVRLQTYTNIEVTLINDQTPDNSVEIAENFITKNQLANWKIYHLEKNSGLSVVRNKGIDTAQGKYLFFLDSDDIITPDCIATLVEISERTSAEMTISQLECVKRETGEKSLCIKINSEEETIAGNLNILTAFANNQLVTYAVNKLFLMDFLKENQIYFMVGLLAEDELWSFQMILKLKKISIFKGITYTYYLHSKSIIHNRDSTYFDHWFTIAQYIDEALKKEQNFERKRLILMYMINYKKDTLAMNWKAQKNEKLWKKSYANYKTLSSLTFFQYFSAKIPMGSKKANLFNEFPTNLGFKIFKLRYER